MTPFLFAGNITIDPTAVLVNARKYTLTVLASDSGSPINSAKATVRVDTFNPDDVVVAFNMSITEADFEPLSDQFASKKLASRELQQKDKMVWRCN